VTLYIWCIHPDRSCTLQALQQAYAVLRDNAARTQYDAYGWDAVQHGLDAALFDMRQERGTDIATTAALSFHEAADGGVKALRVLRLVICAACEVRAESLCIDNINDMQIVLY
jgi:DnaJ-class molecular chaperone